MWSASVAYSNKSKCGQGVWQYSNETKMWHYNLKKIKMWSAGVAPWLLRGFIWLVGGGRTEHQPGWQPDTSLFLIFCFFFIPPFSSYLFFSIFSLEYIQTLFPQLLLHFAGTYVLEWSPGFVWTHSISLLQWAILIPADNDISDPSDKDEVESK